jgi:hypothetical protein
LSAPEGESGEGFESGLDFESIPDSGLDSDLELGFDFDFLLELEDVLDFG